MIGPIAKIAFLALLYRPAGGRSIKVFCRDESVTVVPMAAVPTRSRSMATRSNLLWAPKDCRDVPSSVQHTCNLDPVVDRGIADHIAFNGEGPQAGE